MTKLVSLVLFGLAASVAVAQDPGFKRSGVALPFISVAASNQTFMVDRGGGLSPANLPTGSYSNTLRNAWVSDIGSYAGGDGTYHDALTELKIPCPDGLAATVQFSCAYSPTNWNGYRYWGVHTPFPGVTREQVAVVASHDGVSWVLPHGQTNAIATRTSLSNEFNPVILVEDTDLVFLTNGNLAVYFAGENNTETYIFCAQSADSINWSIGKVLTNTGAASTISTSPVREHDGTISLWYHTNTPLSTVGFIRLSGDGTNLIQSATACTLPEYVPGQGDTDGGNYNWHFDIERVGYTNYVMVRTRQGLWDQYCYWSTDRTNWNGYLLQTVASIPNREPYWTTTGNGLYKVNLQFPYADRSLCDMYVSCSGTNNSNPTNNPQWRIALRRQVPLPVPWAGNLGSGTVDGHLSPPMSLVAATTNAWIGANVIIGHRVNVGSVQKLNRVRFWVDTSSGNVAGCILQTVSDASGSFTAKLIASTGSVACPAAGLASLDFPDPVILQPGEYVLALWADNTTFKTLNQYKGTTSFEYLSGLAGNATGSTLWKHTGSIQFTKSGYILSGLFAD